MKISPPALTTTTTSLSMQTSSPPPLLSKSSSSSSPVAQALLNDNKYDIEFHGYLSNHVKHAIIALDKLHAPDKRIQGYWEEYTTVTPYDIVLDKVKNPFSDPSLHATTKEEWSNNRGKKVQWQEMVKFLEQEQETSNLDIDALVKLYAPDLLPGSAGALTHGIIHLGWAIDAGNPWMTLEGLAYLNFCHLPVGQPLHYQALEEDDAKDVVDGCIDQSYVDIAMKSVVDVATEYHTKNLQETWIETTKSKYDETFHPELVPSGFQWHLAKVLHDAHPISTTIPTWIKSTTGNEEKQMLSIDKVWESMYYIMTIIYLSTRTAATPSSTVVADAAVTATDKTPVDTEDYNGNFVVLHLLTSLWGLEKTCEVIGEESVSRVALSHFWTIAVCLLATSTTGFPAPQQLKDTIEKYPYHHHVPTGNLGTTTSDNVVPLVDWTTTIERGIAEREEHNIKLVYVTQELYRRYKNHWFGYAEAGRSFTLTPNIRPTKPKFDA